VRIDRRFFGKVEAENVGYAGDVEAPSAQVARKEIAQLSLRETLEGDAASLLIHARMYRPDREAEGGEGEPRFLDAGRHR
jgi:hypothetical protein